jgi:peptide/nickel transport system substrate-binding protein
MALPASRRDVLKAVGAGTAALTVGSMFAPVPPALAQDSQGAKVLRTNTTTEIYAWDPHLHGGTSGMTALRHIFDRLVTRDGTKLVGQLATDWKLIDDLTWEFTLRDDAHFHDGHQLTAEDVKASLDRLAELKDQYLYPFWDDYESAEVVDDFTVRIKTKTLKADMLPSLEVLVIGPAHLMDDPNYSNTMIGSGPFRFVEFRPGEVLRMEANPDYWGGGPAIAGIEFYEIPETSSRVTALLAGDLDIVSALEPDSVPVVEGNESTKVVSVPSWVRDLAFLNHHLEKYQDLRVREALWLAIDTQEIVDGLFPPGLARVMKSTVSSQALDFKDLGPYPYDPERARALLAEAGYGPGNPLRVRPTYVSGSGILLSEIVTLVGAYWSAIGVQVDIAEQDEATYQEERTNRSYEIQFTQNSGGLGDVASNEGRLFHSSDGRFGFNDPEADRLIEAARSELDPAAQSALWGELQEYLRQQVNAIYLVELSGLFGVGNEVGNFNPGPDVLRADFRAVTLGE